MVLKTENFLTRIKKNIFQHLWTRYDFFSHFFYCSSFNAACYFLIFLFFSENNILLTSIHMNTLIRENYFLSSQFTLCSLQHRELKIFFICLILLSLPIVTNVQNAVLHSNVSFYIMFMYFFLPTKYIKLKRKFLR